MPKVTVCTELSEAHYRALESEAKRRGVAVETLVEQMVNALVSELEDDTDSDFDHTVSVS